MTVVPAISFCFTLIMAKSPSFWAGMNGNIIPYLIVMVVPAILGIMFVIVIIVNVLFLKNTNKILKATELEAQNSSNSSDSGFFSLAESAEGKGNHKMTNTYYGFAAQTALRSGDKNQITEYCEKFIPLARAGDDEKDPYFLLRMKLPSRFRCYNLAVQLAKKSGDQNLVTKFRDELISFAESAEEERRFYIAWFQYGLAVQLAKKSGDKNLAKKYKMKSKEMGNKLEHRFHYPWRLNKTKRIRIAGGFLSFFGGGLLIVVGLFILFSIYFEISVIIQGLATLSCGILAIVGGICLYRDKTLGGVLALIGGVVCLVGNFIPIGASTYGFFNLDLLSYLLTENSSFWQGPMHVVYLTSRLFPFWIDQVLIIAGGIAGLAIGKNK